MKITSAFYDILKTKEQSKKGFYEYRRGIDIFTNFLNLNNISDDISNLTIENLFLFQEHLLSNKLGDITESTKRNREGIILTFINTLNKNGVIDLNLARYKRIQNKNKVSTSNSKIDTILSVFKKLEKRITEIEHLTISNKND